MARPFAAPGTVFNARISDRRNLAYAELDLDDIKAVKNHFGVKVKDVVMALVSGVLRQYLMFRRPRGFRHRDADLLTQHHRDVAAGQTRHRACRLDGPRPDLWEMADEFAVGMEELLAHAR